MAQDPAPQPRLTPALRRLQEDYRTAQDPAGRAVAGEAYAAALRAELGRILGPAEQPTQEAPQPQ